MPFTFSHPAIVLPFLKSKKVSATALVFGSMSPDFEYFFRMKMQSEISHTFLGVLLIDFPLGFLMMFVFHQIIKKPLIDNSPIFVQNRLAILRETNWIQYFKNNITIVLVSFFLGAISHLFWDSMTHWDGYLVQVIPFLNLEVYAIPMYKIAQHLSTIIGLGIVLFYIYKQPYEDKLIDRIAFKYWYMSFSCAAVILAVRFSFGLPLDEIGSVIVSILFSGVLAVTAVGLFFRSRKTS
jgi:hypothetical protein